MKKLLILMFVLLAGFADAQINYSTFSGGIPDLPHCCAPTTRMTNPSKSFVNNDIHVKILNAPSGIVQDLGGYFYIEVKNTDFNFTAGVWLILGDVYNVEYQPYHWTNLHTLKVEDPVITEYIDLSSQGSLEFMGNGHSRTQGSGTISLQRGSTHKNGMFVTIPPNTTVKIRARSLHATSNNRRDIKLVVLVGDSWDFGWKFYQMESAPYGFTRDILYRSPFSSSQTAPYMGYINFQQYRAQTGGGGGRNIEY